MLPDHRTNAYRPDLADASLRDTIKAEKYLEPILRQCLTGILPMLASPSADAKQTSQVKYGEFLDIFEMRDDGFAWAQNRFDRYVGYVPLKDPLGESIAMMSNRIIALRTFVYPEPDMKKPPMDELTLGSFVSVAGKKGDFLELNDGGFVFAKHIASTDAARAPDYIFTAGRMLGTPYLWGGRTPKGIDCSGLVQIALEMAGIDVPRDTDQQCDALAKPLASHWRDYAWHRGDVVFFPGHVGIMTGVDHILHASTHSMDVVVEPLAEVVARNKEVTGVACAADLQKM